MISAKNQRNQNLLPKITEFFPNIFSNLKKIQRRESEGRKAKEKKYGIGVEVGEGEKFKGAKAKGGRQRIRNARVEVG